MKRVRPTLPLSLSHGLRRHCRNRPQSLQPYAQLPSRHFAITTRMRAEPKTEEPAEEDEGWNTKPDKDGVFFARLLPKSRAYFSSTPNFIDTLLEVEELGRKFGHLPKINSADQRRVSWRPISALKNSTGEAVRPGRYKKITTILQQLNKIHPAVMPRQVKDVLKEYRDDVDFSANRPNVVTVDRMGRGLGAGRRKRSTARAWLVEGTGEVLVNGKTLAEAFGRIHDRESAIWGLKATERIDKYNVWALVSGGGTTGQAEALQLAVAKALIVHEPALKTALRRAGCVTRDPRKVERKKPNHLKARKKPAWVKR